MASRCTHTGDIVFGKQFLPTALLDIDNAESGDDVYQTHDLTHGGWQVELICGIVDSSCGRQWAALLEVEGLAWGERAKVAIVEENLIAGPER
jgi:hypothetical protein